MKTERFLSQNDATTLSRLAENMLRMREINFNHAERVIELITTSVLLPETDQRNDFVRLHSGVVYRAVGTVDLHSIVIACPRDANESNHALSTVSLLTPLAMALIGRVVGSIVAVELPFGQIQYVEVVAVLEGRDMPRADSHSYADGVRPAPSRQ